MHRLGSSPATGLWARAVKAVRVRGATTSQNRLPPSQEAANFLSETPAPPNEESFAWSGRICHYLQLHQAARLLLLQVFASLLDVYVVPGQDLAHRPGAVRVPGHVDAQVSEGLPPDLGLEALAPTVKPAAT